jgi:hypothetical protein
VLIYRGKKQGWDIPGALNRVDFSGLVDSLQSHWRAISKNFPGIDKITVIGFDLTKRFN